MGLGTALTTAVSSLKANQDSLSITSQNIANANSTDYTTREVVQSNNVVNGVPAGVNVDAIRRLVDDFITSAAREQTTVVGKTDVRVEYFERIELFFGNPGENNSINSFVDDFFASISDLTNSPEQSSLRSAALEQGVNLSSKVSALAADLEDVRYLADQEINSTINKLNTLLRSALSINKSIADAAAVNSDTSELLDRRDAILRDISEIIDVDITFSNLGEMTLFVPEGELLNPSSTFEVVYSPLTSAQSFIDGQTIGEIALYATDINGARLNRSATLLSASDITPQVNNIRDGRLQGLIEVRDTDIVNMLAQLDELAETLQDSFNAIHNDGVGFPPPTSLTGSRLVAGTDDRLFSGKIQIAMLNSDGTPVANSYKTGNGLLPLTLDLDTISGGVSQGQMQVQDIIDEINQYFGPPPNAKASVGNLDDIKLVASSDVTVIGAGVSKSVEYDFEFTNLAGTDSTFEVLSVAIDNGADGYVGTALPGGFSAFTATAGQRLRTDVDGVASDSITLDFTNSTLTEGDTHTVSIQVQVTDSQGNITTETIDYAVKIPVGTEDVRNTRYIATGISGAEDGTLSSPVDNSRFATAQIVDADGVVITDGSQGYLQIVSNITGYGIAINELDSNDNGDPADTINTITNRGLSHYFGLNDFFTSDAGTKNSAVTLKVRDEYKSDASRFASSQLNLSVQPSDPTANPYYTYEIGAGGNEISTRLADLRFERATFDSAGTLPQSTLTLAGYAAEILSYASTKAQNANQDQSQEQLLLTAFTDRIDAIGGVNIDQELANTVIFQNNYSASARMISVIDELFDTLIQTF